MTGPIREEIRHKANVFLDRWPSMGRKLKACHDRGLSASEAANDPEVVEEQKKVGCIMAIIAFIAIVNVLWEFWDHLKEA